VNLQFDHSYNFEFDGGGNYDGGVVEISINGGAFSEMGTGAYNGTLAVYSGNVNPLAGRPGFVQNSAGIIHSSITRAVAAGSVVQIRFRMGSDQSVGSAGWFIDNIAFTGLASTPFSILVPELTPTAAPVSLGGRVTNAAGYGLSQVLVGITDMQGVSRFVLSNQFGYYRFDGLASGGTYTIQASAKRYRFTPQAITLNGSLADFDITADP
jgi:hypothetical protein